MEIPAKKLGFGFMRLPLLDSNDKTSVDLSQTERMVDLFLQKGFTYFDTAWMYHDFTSENVLGKVLVDRYPRDSFTIATKMPDMMLKSRKQGEEIYEAQKKKLHVDYFDYYLLHDMMHTNYALCQKLGILDFLKKKWKTGEIRCLGFSVHDTPEFLEKVLTECPFFEFVQLQINYLDWESAGVQAHKCYDVCVKHGKKVVVMEPVKGGSLANPPKEVAQILAAAHPDWSPAQWAIKFAASLPQVMTVLSGMSTMAQLEDNTSYMEHFTPLTGEEVNLLLKVAETVRHSIAIPCTGCSYCVEASHCPKNILIPKLFALYNTRAIYKPKMEKNAKLWSPELEYYNNYLADGFGSAGDCLHCRSCERVCPQHLKISEWMPKVQAELGQYVPTTVERFQDEGKL